MLHVLFFFSKDMTEERNMLLQDVYPKITDYAKKKYGVSFQVRFFRKCPVKVRTVHKSIYAAKH